MLVRARARAARPGWTRRAAGARARRAAARCARIRARGCRPASRCWSWWSCVRVVRQRALAARVERDRRAIEILACAIEAWCISRSSRRRSFASTSTDRGAIGDRQLGGRGRRRRARIGGEVGEREIDLVTDGADHRHRAARDRAHDALVVERGEVGHGAAAAPDDHDVDARRARPSPCPSTIWCGAFGPCTTQSAIRIGVGSRRWTVRMMSWIAAPLLRGHDADPPRETAAAAASSRRRTGPPRRAWP